MLLSIIIPGKNDSFRSLNALKFNIQQTIQNLKNLKIDDVEIILCDWGSEIKLIDSLITEKHPQFKCLYVSPEITKKYNGEAEYSIVHPLNAGFRKSSGKYVIFWDSDCFVPEYSFLKLYEFVKNMDANNDKKFYWGSRYHIPKSIHENANSTKDITEYILSNNNLSHDKIDNDNFRGCSISIIMNRELWESSTGWWEKLIYWGWQDIEFHYRLLQKYEYGGDLDHTEIKFYHFAHDTMHANKKINPYINSELFEANDKSWGLIEEKLELLT